MRKLEAKDLRRLGKHEFNRFCRMLLDVEYQARFGLDEVALYGPASEDVGDGGHDLLSIVKKPPRAGDIAFWTLLPSEPCEVWYSCKSHKDDGDNKDPGGWRTQVRDDLDPSPRLLDGRSGKLANDPDAILTANPKKKPPSPSLLEALAKGGRYFVLVNLEGELVRELERDMQLVLEFWVRREIDATANLHADAVVVRDATHLANVFNERPFSLPAEIEHALQLAEPQFLLDWDQWNQRYPKERRFTHWKPDDERSRLIEKIHRFVTEPAQERDETGKKEKYSRVYRLWGPPGVGKTRLVHQALDQLLAGTGGTSRVRFTEDAQEVRRWLAGRKYADDLILVVDELPASDATSLAKEFELLPQKGTRLIMVGPQELGHVGEPQPTLLERLDEAQTRSIFTDELGDDPRVDLVVGLCRGYPLFAHWLAKALSGDASLLRERLADPKASLTDDEDPWDATCAVLVGPRGGDEVRWRKIAECRGKALLLVAMSTERVWTDFSDDLREKIAEALKTTWSDLEDAGRACEQRSLLRRRGQLYYVSPANLERLLLNHFFSDGPGGPPLDPRRLARELPDFFAALGERVEVVYASESCRRGFVRATTQVFEHALHGRDTRTLHECSELLLPATRLGPEEMLPLLERLVREQINACLTAGSLQDSIRLCLRHIGLRHTSAAVFERVESLLYLLASAFEERKTWPDPQFLTAWAALFYPVYHLTRQPFEVRFARLRARLHSAERRERVLATEALCTTVEGDASVGWSE
ncbi:MAG: hypothetical protein KC431_10360, partial [Myxococcales bacterium]|nr:hypothetical protein [Myxococcales bacterium]